MSSQNEVPGTFEFTLNKSGDSLAGQVMDGPQMKTAVENFNQTRGITGAEHCHPDLSLYNSDKKMLRMLEISENNRAAIIGDLKFVGDENGEWKVTGTIRPDGPFANKVIELQQGSNLAFGMRALKRHDELQIIGWDIVDPGNK